MAKPYINQLQDTVETLSSQKRELQEGIKELKSYLQSSKFNCGDELDGYVNIQDVLNRLPEIIGEYIGA
jgi:chromosome segregation ATPase